MTSFQLDNQYLFDFEEFERSFDGDTSFMESTQLLCDEIGKTLSQQPSFHQSRDESQQMGIFGSASVIQQNSSDVLCCLSPQEDVYLRAEEDMLLGSFADSFLERNTKNISQLNSAEVNTGCNLSTGGQAQLLTTALSFPDTIEPRLTEIMLDGGNFSFDLILKSGDSVENSGSSNRTGSSPNTSLDSGFDSPKPNKLKEDIQLDACFQDLPEWDSHSLPVSPRVNLKRAYLENSDDEEYFPHLKLRQPFLIKSPQSSDESSRFKSWGFIGIERSKVQCLEVELNYYSYTGLIKKVIINNNLTNYAYREHDRKALLRRAYGRINDVYRKKPHESYYGEPQGTIGMESGVLQRKIYFRDLSEIENMVSFISYERSTKFHYNRPYEAQYIRYELDEYQSPITESKCGLCSFCVEVKFYPYKNSTYLSHLTLMHGVFPNNFVVPEGLYVGQYRMSRTSISRKKCITNGLQCPVCFQLIPIKCWRTKTNPLLSYFRHFKKSHQRESRTLIKSKVNPVTFEP